MKKAILAIVLALAMMSPVALASQGDGQQQGNDQPVLISQQTSSNTQAVEAPKVMAQSTVELQSMVQEREMVMEQEMANATDSEKKVLQNQNQVRSAVHALLAMEDLVGGIGPQVSEIARGFNNSVQATINAEEKMQNRNAVESFFFGGDEVAAQEMEQEVVQNMARIQELNTLMADCNCTQEVRAVMQEQVQAMETEQNRLQDVAEEQKANKGLIGWLFK